MTDAQIRARVSAFVSGGLANGDPAVLQTYGELVADRGKLCGDHLFTVLGFGRSGPTPGELDAAIDVLVQSYPRLVVRKTKAGGLVLTGIALGAAGAGFALSDPIVRVFASVGIVGAVLLALILLFREPISKVLFSKLGPAATERVINKMLIIIGIVTVTAVVGGVAVAVIKSLRPGG